ncbi:MAG: heavy-metal-associated domain-containing protein [Saprospiraceae bacterium]
MVHTYKIEGMTCGGCAKSVKSALLNMPDVLQAEVDKATDSATITMDRHIPLIALEEQLQRKDPKFHISTDDASVMQMEQEKEVWLATYQPILTVFAYITLITLAIQFANGGFDAMQWMRHFMAGFFLTFSFFKMLNLSAFADSYQMYDVIAKRFRAWGYLYAFIELGLGIAFLINFNPLATNALAFTVMTISIIGVLQSVLNKQQIQCACLGAVFNLPMSTVTIVEDALMIAMSGGMLWMLLGS